MMKKQIQTLIPAFAAAQLFMTPAAYGAQGNPVCTPERDLLSIPEIQSKNGVLKGVVTLADEKRAMAGKDGACDWQHLRYFSGYSLQDKKPPAWPAGRRVGTDARNPGSPAAGAAGRRDARRRQSFFLQIHRVVAPTVGVFA